MKDAEPIPILLYPGDEAPPGGRKDDPQGDLLDYRKTKMRLLIAAAVLAVATPVLADETTGEVLAFDRVDHVLVLADKTIWQVPETLELPIDLAKGDRIHIDFTEEGDAGIVSIEKITRIEG